MNSLAAQITITRGKLRSVIYLYAALKASLKVANASPTGGANRALLLGSISRVRNLALDLMLKQRIDLINHQFYKGN